MANLSIELLKSFVAVVEKGSIQKATEQIFLTQSALSQQIRRLEDIVQRPLFYREVNRKLTITPAGEELLAYARQLLALNDEAIAAVRGIGDAPLRVGVVQDFSEGMLPDILRRYREIHPDSRLEIRVAGSDALLQALELNQLDIALSVSSQPDDANIVGSRPTRWLGDPELATQKIVPIVVMGGSCPYRKIALQTLKRVHRQHFIAAEVQDLASLHAAVQAKLAVTCRPQSFARQEEAPVIEPPLLPPLPEIYYVLHHRVTEDQPGWTLKEMMRTSFITSPEPKVAAVAAGR